MGPNGAEIVPAQSAMPVAQPVSITLTPVDLLSMAVTQGADLDKLEKLMELQLRWEANEARKAFDAAMTKFKANPPEILKNKHVKFGQTEYDHATLDNACEQIIPALSAVGITHSWKPRQEKDMIYITCVLKGFGHVDETTLFGPPDNSGSKNAIQAISSTVSYLERYTLFAACGLAAKGQETGGVDSPPPSNKPVVAAEKIEEYCRQMAEVYNVQELMKVFAKAINEAQELNDRKAMEHYVRARDTKQKEFTNARR